ncbi:MAG: aldo/keto reductase [Sulfobacillus thermosulfidooxidans]|uniref:aldo/keto reductase n=1 Tax=Sulfobacillus TaxID=28033 RepID=UPI000CD1DC98|nr:aldo/keto reductase [Sulfobacillus sp. hq2]POB11030.1 aldo/keto reductase [Sulfobacillus sp. hq2]PSR37501.1 MAG: aldo/keto reductase [Sulfobacillus thermosulfidooxidans]
MQYRPLGTTGLEVSALSFGTWAIGGSWGSVEDEQAREGIARAIELGVNFFDTADVYGNGRSEQLLGDMTHHMADRIAIATKFGRSGDWQDPANYQEPAIRAFCEASLRRLQRDTIDLYQIHCPPTWVIERGDVFAILDQLQQEGKIRAYGVSVETVDEGLLALQYPGVKALQVIFNLFRQKPLDQLFPQAQAQNVGILARVPLASGLLTGKFRVDHQFAADDHRAFNKNGEYFNVGETFAGIPFETGVALAHQLQWIAQGRETMARAALRWVIDSPGVTCAIPGFKSAKQVEDNLAALTVPSFTEEERAQLQQFYQEAVAPTIRGRY